MDMEFDVFLSHNSDDKPAVIAIAEGLEDKGLKVWLDRDQLRPGEDWQPALEKGIRTSKATAVFIGPAGMGPWHNQEIQAALTWAIDNKRPVILVGLPGIPKKIDLPLFLTSKTWVRFETLDQEERLDELKWGITGERPPRQRRRRRSQEEPDEQATSDPVEEAVQRLAAALRSGSVTYFVGNDAFTESSDYPPGGTEIALQLLRKLNLAEDSQIAQLDLAAEIYAIKDGDTLLENAVADMIADSSHSIPPLYHTLTELLELHGRRPPVRSRGSSHRLIVTTNFDVLLERALVTAAMPFSRIVQHRSAPYVQINTYEGVRRVGDDAVDLSGKGTVPIKAIDDLDEWIEQTGVQEKVDPKEVHFAQMIQPILYKCHGSLDVKDSCAISTSHYLAFARATSRSDFSPRSVNSTIGTTPALFLGCHPLDPEFIVLYHGLLREPFQVGTEQRLRFAPMLPAGSGKGDLYHRLESRLWDSIGDFTLQRMGIKILKSNTNEFLERLLEAVRSQTAP